MQPATPTFPGMEATLRDACERAMQCAFPLLTMLRLYRAVAGLTRALMQARADLCLPAGLSNELVALLEQVRDTVGLHFPDRDMPVNDALCLHTATMALARAAHRARVGRILGRLPRAEQTPAAPPKAPEREPTPRPSETMPLDPGADDDTPEALDLRVKRLNGDPRRDAMSQRYDPNDGLEGDYAKARRQNPRRPKTAPDQQFSL
jgi:hypothetical protein